MTGNTQGQKTGWQLPAAAAPRRRPVPRRTGAVLDKLAHALARRLRDALQQVHVGEHALVGAGVHRLDVAADGARQDAGQAQDGLGLLVGAVQLCVCVWVGGGLVSGLVRAGGGSTAAD